MCIVALDSTVPKTKPLGATGYTTTHVTLRSHSGRGWVTFTAYIKTRHSVKGIQDLFFFVLFLFQWTPSRWTGIIEIDCMCCVLPCSHAQQQHRSSSVQARCLSFASEPLPEDLHHCGLQVAAAPKELLHLDRTKTTSIHLIVYHFSALKCTQKYKIQQWILLLMIRTKSEAPFFLLFAMIKNEHKMTQE